MACMWFVMWQVLTYTYDIPICDCTSTLFNRIWKCHLKWMYMQRHKAAFILCEVVRSKLAHSLASLAIVCRVQFNVFLSFYLCHSIYFIKRAHLKIGMNKTAIKFTTNEYRYDSRKCFFHTFTISISFENSAIFSQPKYKCSFGISSLLWGQLNCLPFFSL